MTLNKNGKLSLIDAIANRKSLHVDVTGKVSESKSNIRKIIDGFKGVKDEDSHKKGKGGKNFSMRDREEKVIDDYRSMGYYLDDNLVFNPGKSVFGCDFIRLSDKGAYILQIKKDILKALTTDNIINKLVYSQKLNQKEFGILSFIKYYLDLGYINIDDIRKIVRIFLRKKAEEVTSFKTKKSFFENILPIDRNIIGWGIINGVFIETYIQDIEERSGKIRGFFEYYVDKTDFEEGIVNLIIRN